MEALAVASGVRDRHSGHVDVCSRLLAPVIPTH